MSTTVGEQQQEGALVNEQGFDPGRRRLLKGVAISAGVVATPPLLYAGYRILENVLSGQSDKSGSPVVETLVLGLPSNYIETHVDASSGVQSSVDTLMGRSDWQLKGDDPPSPNRLHARMEDGYGQRLSVSVAVPSKRWNELNPQPAPSGWMFNTSDGQYFNFGTVLANHRMNTLAPQTTVYEKETPGPRGSGSYVLEGYINPGASEELYFNVVAENLNSFRNNEQSPGANGRSMFAFVAQLLNAGALGPVSPQ